MFVVFEGIDGSGKTTISNMVAKRLRARGIEVEHIREGGSYTSSLVNRMREFGKDCRNLAMAPLTELLFYTARDAQLMAESIRPALDRGTLVIADRYLYSYEVLGRDGRGLPDAQVRAVIDAVSGGIWPDLVLLMDVDPQLARARRQVGKLGKKAAGESSSVSGSRKGLQGIGTQHRLRDGYLAVAAREPERWVVVDNSDPHAPESTLKAIVSRLADLIADMWKGHNAVAAPAPALGHSTKPAAPAESGIAPASAAWAVTPASPAISDMAGARHAFYQAMRARGEREVAVAAYFLAGLDDDTAWELRDAWAAHAADAIAYGLRGIGSERAWSLRRRLMDTASYHVARSLDGLAVEGEQADAIRAMLWEREPLAILATLDGNDSQAAWSIREHLMSTHEPAVLGSLKRLDGARAWALRRRYWQSIGGSDASDPVAITPLVDSLRGLDGDEAWSIRDGYLELVPTAVLASLAEVTSERSWDLRLRLVERAPKIAFRTLSGSVDPRAWELRAAHAPRVKEALDSMSGLGGDQAWAIRRQCRDIWPSTIVKSLGPLGLEEPGRALVLDVLARYPDNVSLLKHITKLCALEETLQREETAPYAP